MEVSKFIINDNDVYVKDAEARSELASQSESLSEMQSEIDGINIIASEIDDIASSLSEVDSTVDDMFASLSEVDSVVDSQSIAYSEMFSEMDSDIETAQSTADGKLAPGDAWKIGTVSATRSNASIAAGTYATIQSGPVSGSNVIPLFAYCPTTTQLACIRLYTISGTIYAVMDNIGSSTVSGDVTINIVYAYK